jgi:hypothetical protein
MAQQMHPIPLQVRVVHGEDGVGRMAEFGCATEWAEGAEERHRETYRTDETVHPELL